MMGITNSFYNPLVYWLIEKKKLSTLLVKKVNSSKLILLDWLPKSPTHSYISSSSCIKNGFYFQKVISQYSVIKEI